MDLFDRKLAVSWRDYGLWTEKTLPHILGHSLQVLGPGARPGRDIEAWIGWGCRPSGLRARQLAVRHDLPYWIIEDGFLRSIGLGRDEPPLSLVIDDLGIYYDASRPSRLESLVARRHTPDEHARARTLIASWRAARVSKYNHAREYQGELPQEYVLVIDQTRGDASIRFGSADESSFRRMLEAALAENPDKTVLLKVHPEVVSGRKLGHFNIEELSRNPRVRVLGADVHPVNLIDRADAVYAVTSQVGFEGLLWGKRVRTFGMPFYAGWGLTEDELPGVTRRKPVSLESLVHAALVEYPVYVDPETGNRSEPERVVEWMGLQRRMRERFPETIYALEFYPWKRPIMHEYFQGSKVRFAKRIEEVPDGATLVVWGRRDVGEKKVSLVRLEDGFLRSVGLGADLVRPLSWVTDTRGMYYDATRASGLEELLQTARFDSAVLKRAAALRERVVKHGITKYNVGAARWRRPEGVGRVVLVPGQVETDASIAFGSPVIKRNIDLLRAVRESNRDAYVIYKPHPDVIAGRREPGEMEDVMSRWCDEVVVDCPMGELLGAVDEVHTMTSLAGFEALLRGKKAIVYGQPFYGGWGLTEDRHPQARRTRRLTLDELVAGVLILYPVYVSRVTRRFTTPERALDELLAWRKHGPTRLPVWKKMQRKILGLLNH